MYQEIKILSQIQKSGSLAKQEQALRWSNGNKRASIGTWLRKNLGNLGDLGSMFRGGAKANKARNLRIAQELGDVIPSKTLGGITDASKYVNMSDDAIAAARRNVANPGGYQSTLGFTAGDLGKNVDLNRRSLYGIGPKQYKVPAKPAPAPREPLKSSRRGDNGLGRPKQVPRPNQAPKSEYIDFTVENAPGRVAGSGQPAQNNPQRLLPRGAQTAVPAGATQKVLSPGSSEAARVAKSTASATDDAARTVKQQQRAVQPAATPPAGGYYNPEAKGITGLWEALREGGWSRLTPQQQAKLMQYGAAGFFAKDPVFNALGIN
jgi:hypothetical protein